MNLLLGLGVHDTDLGTNNKCKKYIFYFFNFMLSSKDNYFNLLNYRLKNFLLKN